MEFNVSFFLKWLLMYWSGCAIGRLVLVFKWPVLIMRYCFFSSWIKHTIQNKNKWETKSLHLSIMLQLSSTGYQQWVSEYMFRLCVHNALFVCVCFTVSSWYHNYNVQNILTYFLHWLINCCSCYGCCWLLHLCCSPEYICFLSLAQYWTCL